MSRSYKKNAFHSCNAGSFKSWKQITNQRFRSRSKQVLNTCEDWDNLVMPVIDEVGNYYDSPKDGISWRNPKPLINQCEWDRYKTLNGRGLEFLKWKDKYYGYKNGHFRNCQCYHNKRNWYWKAKRK